MILATAHTAAHTSNTTGYLVLAGIVVVVVWYFRTRRK